MSDDSNSSIKKHKNNNNKKKKNHQNLCCHRNFIYLQPVLSNFHKYRMFLFGVVSTIEKENIVWSNSVRICYPVNPYGVPNVPKLHLRCPFVFTEDVASYHGLCNIALGVSECLGLIFAIHQKQSFDVVGYFVVAFVIGFAVTRFLSWSLVKLLHIDCFVISFTVKYVVFFVTGFGLYGFVCQWFQTKMFWHV